METTQIIASVCALIGIGFAANRWWLLPALLVLFVAWFFVADALSGPAVGEDRGFSAERDFELALILLVLPIEASIATGISLRRIVRILERYRARRKDAGN